MIRSGITLCLFSLLCVAFAGPAGAETFSFANAHLSLTFDAGTGALVRVAAGQTELAAADAGTAAVDVKLNDRWLVADDHAAFRLVGRAADAKAGTITITRAAGPWEIAETYVLASDGPRLSRRVRLVFRGKERGKMKGVRLITPGVIARGDGFYTLPRVYPPVRYAFGALKPGQVRSSGTHLAPAFAQVAPTRTLMWSSDGRDDRVRVEVREGEGAVSVAQYFDALGWVKPGDAQDVGTAYLEVVPAPYERALPAMWKFMDRVGIRVPADRPEWVRDAVVYSFHPGGTIGSNFRDLGGFRAATEELLPRLPELGINAIWIMPVEDMGVYHPRDYYKFQQGLGTPEEFRAMVAKAHALGMNVFQDIVPHGGRNDFPRAKEHPEWLVRDEDGSTLSYWCFDFRWPSWQRYMADVATHYVKEYGVDGYRVDACGGSKIPNWSPDIPYARASHSQLQGGMGMLRALREAVKAQKPREGAILAEVEGAPFLSVSDADYDFALCYQVLHDLRQSSPAEFVTRFQTWMEERKYTDPRGAVRMRHVESHDSLRSQAWYGVQPMRALMALSSWIDGMPMVYHEMEVGHAPFLRRVFTIRKQLPELRRGEAYYQAVRSTPGVFTCLRRLGDATSIVAINLNPEPVRATFSAAAKDLGLRPGVKYAVHDAWSGAVLPLAGGQFAARLEPYGATVFSLRPAGARKAATPAAAAKAPVKPKAVPVRVSVSDAVVLAQNSYYRLSVDRRTGLPRAFQGADGKALLGACDLLLEHGMAKPGAVEFRQSDGGKVLEFSGKLARGGYVLRYHLGEGPELGVEWVLDAPGAGAEMVMPVAQAATWAVDTVEGRLEDQFRVRHRTGQAGTHNIYWRPQGTDIIWQAETVPLRPGGTGIEARRGDKAGVGIGVANLLETGGITAQLLDKFAGSEGLHFVAGWGKQAEAQAAVPRRLALRLSALAPGQAAVARGEALPAGVSLRHTGLDWVIENAHYRVVLRRTGGTIKQLWVKQPKERLVLSSHDIYGDRGFATERKRFGAADDVETGVSVRREGDSLVLSFHGQLRGTYRFDLTRPPVEFRQEYVFNAGPSFRHTWGVNSGRPFRDTEGFLSAIWKGTEGTSFTFLRGERKLAEGTMGPGSRQGETALLPQAETPDTVRLHSAEGDLVTFSGLETRGPAGLRNVFVHGTQLFMAWMDGQRENLTAGAWYEASMAVTPGSARPAPVPAARWTAAASASASVLGDPSLEAAGGLTAVSLVTGKRVKRDSAQMKSMWEVPVGCTVTDEVAHDGALCAKVENPGGLYSLFRQKLATGVFPPGSKVRLSAWVKARDVRRGDASWKTGSLRLMVSGNAPYVQAADFVGDFDWKQISGVVTIPEGTLPLEVQVGLNGATGTCWIDDVQIERVP